MSKEKPDTQETDVASKMWHLHCEGAFMDVKRDIKELQKDHAAFKVDVTKELSALNTYLRNGLTHRLNAVTRFIASVGVILVGAIVLNVVQHFAGGG